MTEAPPRQQSRRAEYAAAITLIASSQVPQPTKSAEIADILLRVAMDAATIPAEAAVKVAKALAELVVVQRLLDRRGRERGVQEPQGGSPTVAPGTPGVAPGRGEPQQPGREPLRPQRAEEDEILRRAMYTIRAAQRMALDVARGKDPSEALERESRHYLAHTEAQQKRRTAKRLRDVMREEHGDLLSWVHGDPKEPRILHEKADGLNVDVSAGAPAATGGVWPGELPGCTCSLGPPRPGALVLE